ncbi:MAG: Flp pilus assembly complex ATPase component TadA [Candidatus Omnitrophica bacterium]|nr:Flp pilus assembly complex ATPase component TadA [Candidatus Omnitrophota bacterium]
MKRLCEKKLLVENDIQKALDIQKEKGGKISDILVGMGLVSRNDLISVLSEELGIPPIDLSRYQISKEVIDLIPKKIAKNYHVLPVSKIGDFLTVATADPLNVFVTDDIAAITGCKISLVIANNRDIEEAIAQYYEAGVTEAIDKIIDDMRAPGDIEVLQDEQDFAMSSSELMRLVQDAPVVKITDMVLTEGIKRRASDILIEPMENSLRIRYRVDGILQEGERPPKKIHAALISRLKVMSNLNIAERRLPQDGRFKIRVHDREVDFRISVLPSSNGEKAALRVLDKKQATLDIERLGFEKEALEELKKAASRPHGMMLLCGPTGCGKTTTLYSILKYVDSPEKNIITAEDPIEYQLEGINQLTVRPELGLTFANSLRSFLRQDPDIIMVGEIRDFDTVDIAIKAALTGHLVLSTLHTTTAAGSVTRLVNMGVEPFLITSSVVLVAAQRLVRRICDNCKEPHKIDKVLSEKLQLKPGAGNMVYKGKGCKECQDTGYKGRVGLIETLPLTMDVRKLVLEGIDESRLKQQARKDGMKTLRENGVSKILKGITTVEEVLRVTVGDQEIPLN